MADNKKKAINELKTGLEKFRDAALKKGWEQDEVDEKVKEVFENFPWYKYKSNKRSWKSSIFNFCIFALIAYLAYGAVMERNRRWKKKIDDYIFDSQISYHTHRVMRILTLPIFKVYDLSKFHDRDCIVNNPFKTEESMDCNFCQGIKDIPVMDTGSPDIKDMLNNDEPFVLDDVENYHNGKVTFQDLQQMFEVNTKQLDDAVCNIKKNTEFETVSEFFKKVPDETTMNNKNISIEWSNCDTYGTRFYRKIFKRPSFISKESEISFEKRVYLLQKDQNSTIEMAEGKYYYLYQVQGKSVFEMKVPSSCHYNCSEDALTSTVNQGDVVVFPSGSWVSSFKTIGEGLNILFLSSFT